MAATEKTNALEEAMLARYKDKDMAWAALLGALLGKISDEQADELIDFYS